MFIKNGPGLLLLFLWLCCDIDYHPSGEIDLFSISSYLIMWWINIARGWSFPLTSDCMWVRPMKMLLWVFRERFLDLFLYKVVEVNSRLTSGSIKLLKFGIDVWLCSITFWQMMHSEWYLQAFNILNKLNFGSIFSKDLNEKWTILFVNIQWGETQNVTHLAGLSVTWMKASPKSEAFPEINKYSTSI